MLKGFEELQRQLGEAEKAMGAIDGELGTVSFDPRDPSSIESAILAVETLVDERLGPYSNNPIVAPVISQMKETYRQAIIDRAAQARLEGGEASETEVDDGR